jgi:two-component system, NtrC family, sensor kinase
MTTLSSPAHSQPHAALHIARRQQQVVSAVSSSASVLQGNVEGTARLITEQVAKLLDIERVSVWLFNDTKDELHCVDLYLLSAGSHTSGGLIQKATFEEEFTYLEATKCVDASDPYTDIRTRGYIDSYLRPNQITSMLDAVVRIGEELIGTVCFEHVNKAYTWQRDDVVFSSQLGDQVALAVSIARANTIHEALCERDAQLQTLNAELEQRVQERTASLQSANEALLRSEQLAALGAIVAGVAHELNTPIGNARMVATTILDNVKALERSVASGTLQKSALLAFTRTQSDGAALLERSLERATSLISSFKSVSADQTSGVCRLFHVGTVFSDILEMLSPSLQKATCRIAIHKSVDERLQMDSYPGALGQVFANLVNNAMLHAFEHASHGNITIQVQRHGLDEVDIQFSDDGCGIAPQLIGQVFNPFYTTKLGQGGSGLGLHLVYNLVTKTLGGHIRVTSELGHGTRFHLHMPLTAPIRDDAAAT